MYSSVIHSLSYRRRKDASTYDDDPYAVNASQSPASTVKFNTYFKGSVTNITNSASRHSTDTNNNNSSRISRYPTLSSYASVPYHNSNLYPLHHQSEKKLSIDDNCRSLFGSSKKQSYTPSYNSLQTPLRSNLSTLFPNSVASRNLNNYNHNSLSSSSSLSCKCSDYVYLSNEEELALKNIFNSVADADGYSNLSTALQQMKANIGNCFPTMASALHTELNKLNHNRSFDEYLTWQLMKESMLCKTNIRLHLDLHSRSDYCQLLKSKGIDFTVDVKNYYTKVCESSRRSIDSVYAQGESRLAALKESIRLKEREITMRHNNTISTIDTNLSRQQLLYEPDKDAMLIDGDDSSSSSSSGINNAMHELNRKVEERLTKLTQEQVTSISSVLNGPGTDDMVISKFNVDMTSKSLKRLNPGTWLNDEVINFYMEMLKERDNVLCQLHSDRKKSHFFSSHFITALFANGNGVYEYRNVKRWTKKFDIFTYDKIYFPININNTHWTCLVVYMQQKRIVFYDSLNGSGKRYLDAFMHWVVDEGKEKKKMDIDSCEWTLESQLDVVPQQTNGIDCGVFTIMCCDFISENLPLSYAQSDIPMLRNKICAQILIGSLCYTINTHT